MAINPHSKYCLSLSGVYNPNYKSKVLQLGGYTLNPCYCIYFKYDKLMRCRRVGSLFYSNHWPKEIAVLVKTSIWVAQIPRKTVLSQSLRKSTLMHTQKYMHTYDWNAVLAPWLQSKPNTSQISTIVPHQRVEILLVSKSKKKLKWMWVPLKQLRLISQPSHIVLLI